MTESTLSMDYETIQETVGVYLGYDPDYTNWTDAQVAEVDAYIQSGLRQFYYPGRAGGMPGGYTWSFLRPTTSLTFSEVTGTVTGQATYASGTGLSTITSVLAGAFTVLSNLRLNSALVGETLTYDTSETGYVISSVSAGNMILVIGDSSAEASGDTFTISRPDTYFLPQSVGGVVGEVHYDPTVRRRPIQVVSEGDIRRMLQLSTIRSRPSFAALTWMAHDMAYGQLRVMRVYPKPDSDYTVRFQAMAIPEKLTNVSLRADWASTMEGAATDNGGGTSEMEVVGPSDIVDSDILIGGTVTFDGSSTAYTIIGRDYGNLTLTLVGDASVEAADDTFVISFPTSDKYPLGAMMHGETILNSCLAIAERRSEDETGIHAAAFMQSLQASYEIDRQTTTPRHMGYNGDDSDGGGGYFGRDTYVNVNGVRPGI